MHYRYANCCQKGLIMAKIIAFPGVQLPEQKQPIYNIVVGVPYVVAEDSEEYDVILAYRKFDDNGVHFGVEVCHISQLATDEAFRFTDEQLGELITEIQERYNTSLSQTYLRTIANSVVEAPVWHGKDNE